MLPHPLGELSVILWSDLQKEQNDFRTGKLCGEEGVGISKKKKKIRNNLLLMGTLGCLAGHVWGGGG